MRTPVLMFTALDAVGDRVAGLDAGADDYLPKPFAAEELLARVRALSRRPAEWEGGAALRRGDVELRVQDRLLTGPAGAHTLSGRECALLELFLRNPGVTLPRERILLNVWGPDSEVESGNIDNYIHLVRRRLRLVGSRMELVTQAGRGLPPGGRPMLRRLRARITLLAALLTGAVLTGALLFAFGVACRQYTDSRRSPPLRLR